MGVHVRRQVFLEPGRVVTHLTLEQDFLGSLRLLPLVHLALDVPVWQSDVAEVVRVRVAGRRRHAATDSSLLFNILWKLFRPEEGGIGCVG